MCALQESGPGLNLFMRQLAFITGLLANYAKKLEIKMLKWIIGLVVIAVLGWFSFQYVNNNAAIDVENAAAEAAATATEAADTARASATEALTAAQEAMPEGVDLSKITDGFDGVFSSAGEAFGSITDAESAQAALPSLEDASGTLSGLSDTVARLPEAAQGPIGSIVGAGLSTLKPLVEKATAIPGVGDVINPVVTPMLEMLEGLAG